MKSTIHLGILLLCLIALATLTTVSGRLKCYQCKVEANSLCTDDYLLPCPDDQAYDTCMTTIEQTKSRFIITKTCALGPCNLLDSKQSTGLGLDHCDRSSSEYSCVHCCKDDGCNKDGVDNVHPSLVTMFILLFLTTVVFLSFSG
ncbi:uncharacterized protein LOC111089405 [Limulus polyphemus]|uniref:Uncharacterized protein LOC111089405 n=1 Tax=Limulus polyphemus TaxID=6850 RepID=A0ABM1TNU0_LIMPO|nr:uncharacterized protein LOC111089405 [Limulus polyphemus]